MEHPSHDEKRDERRQQLMKALGIDGADADIVEIVSGAIVDGDMEGFICWHKCLELQQELKNSKRSFLRAAILSRSSMQRNCEIALTVFTSIRCTN